MTVHNYVVSCDYSGLTNHCPLLPLLLYGFIFVGRGVFPPPFVRGASARTRRLVPVVVSAMYAIIKNIRPHNKTIVAYTCLCPHAPGACTMRDSARLTVSCALTKDVRTVPTALKHRVAVSRAQCAISVNRSGYCALSHLSGRTAGGLALTVQCVTCKSFGTVYIAIPIPSLCATRSPFLISYSSTISTVCQLSGLCQRRLPRYRACQVLCRSPRSPHVHARPSLGPRALPVH